jgi:hypothetical protein
MQSQDRYLLRLYRVQFVPKFRIENVIGDKITKSSFYLLIWTSEFPAIQTGISDLTYHICPRFLTWGDIRLVVPLKGSVSPLGDLMPLDYIPGAIEALRGTGMQLSARQRAARCGQWVRQKLSFLRVLPRIRTTYKAVEVVSLIVVAS